MTVPVHQFVTHSPAYRDAALEQAQQDMLDAGRRLAQLTAAEIACRLVAAFPGPSGARNALLGVDVCEDGHRHGYLVDVSDAVWNPLWTTDVDAGDDENLLPLPVDEGACGRLTRFGNLIDDLAEPADDLLNELLPEADLPEAERVRPWWQRFPDAQIFRLEFDATGCPTFAAPDPLEGTGMIVDLREEARR